MHRIDPRDLALAPFRKLDQDWALLVSGRERPNPMTVSWGGFGTLWNRPVVTVYVRRVRHTFGCLEETGSSRSVSCPARGARRWRSAGSCPDAIGTSGSPPGSSRSRARRSACHGWKGAELALEARVLASVDLTPDRFPGPLAPHALRRGRLAPRLPGGGPRRLHGRGAGLTRAHGGASK
jgi:hypothetical protein